MIADWKELNLVVSTIYYTGVGATLLVTALRWFHASLSRLGDDRKLVEEIREFHLQNIYSALGQIAKKLEIELEMGLTILTPGYKPSDENLWTRLGLLHRKK